ncbi:conserved protein of unknown function [Ectopseudomonas oleovorans]|uniref:Uncharacterized protein n=1 Tax=Ectopseudomonas oleovorans TaxID=301 RepID=A0A653B052_ECTOL|nr:conserved protein of unknown function [Pseudomonas oleovorans]
MNDPLWIWQQPNWQQFSWQAEALAPLLRACSQAQGRLLGMLGAKCRAAWMPCCRTSSHLQPSRVSS